MKEGAAPAKVIDATTMKALADRLAEPRHPPQQQPSAAPVKFVLQRNSNTGRLEEVAVPLRRVSSSAQEKSMASMHERAVLAEQKRQKKLADKYLQPLVATKKIDNVNAMMDHILKLNKLHRGRSSQSEHLR